ncbi:MAG: hypothetical protein ACOH1N_04165 [Lutibacter sp.]
MTIKRILKSLLIALAIGGLSYLGFLFVNSPDGQYTSKPIMVFGSIGLVLFVVGVSLVGNTKIKS